MCDVCVMCVHTCTSFSLFAGSMSCSTVSPVFSCRSSSAQALLVGEKMVQAASGETFRPAAYRHHQQQQQQQQQLLNLLCGVHRLSSLSAARHAYSSYLAAAAPGGPGTTC
jgi:hypothetical protein